jgi:hypothetical protein
MTLASSVSLGYPCYDDGMSWTSLLSRQFVGGAATWDANASATAVTPLSGVFGGSGSPLQVTQAASPAMSVLVNPGYAAVAHLNQGHGVYIFGLTGQAALTVAANSSGQTRVDLVLARVYDTANSSSYCDVEIVEGTPGAGQAATPGTSLLLAAVSVASGAASITNSSITDKRTYTAAPGGILPASTAAAPPAAPGQVVYDTSTGTLERLASSVTSSQTWSEPGTYSWTVPAGCLPPRMQAWAAGSGGGGYDGSDNDSASGGPGGEYAEEPGWEGLTEGQEIVITVGAPGAASGVGEANQTAGGNTTFVLGVTALVTAHAGAAGVNTNGTTVAGGTGSGNTIHFNGGAGGPGGSTAGGAGGGGASAGPGAAGTAGGTGDNPYGGYGGSAVPGGGPGGQGGGHDGNGQPPAYGPGGGGGGGSGATNGSGAGMAGQAVLTWTVQPTALTAFATSSDADLDAVDTSTGTAGSSGLYPGDTNSAYGWGIGFGSVSGGDTDNNIEEGIALSFTADGSTDFEISAKWGFTVPAAALESSSYSATKGQCQIVLAIDYNILDTVCLRCALASGVVQPAGAGSFSYYTSASRGTTPSAGSHLAILAIQTESTYVGGRSGAAVGNLASTGTSTAAFGSVPSYFTSALTAENCYLRVSGISASAL